MFAFNPLFPFGLPPGGINEAHRLPGPPGGEETAGPTTIRVTDPAQYARPAAPQAAQRIPYDDATPAAASSAEGGMFAPKKGHKGLFPGKDWKTFAQMAAMALLSSSASRGNPAAQIQLRGMMEGMQQRQKLEAARQQQEGVAQALVASGVDPTQAYLLAANPEKVAEQLATRFQTRNVDEGSSVYTPGLDGAANVFTAPKYFQHDADVVGAPAQQTQMPGMFGSGRPFSAPPLGVPSLRTKGEQFADSIAERGTPAWNEAVENYALKAYGPNADQMLDKRLTTQRDIAYHRDATSTANTRYRVDHPAPRAGAKAAAPKAPTPATVAGRILDKMARGEPLTPAEQEALRESKTPRKSVRSGAGGAARPRSKAEFDALPRGTPFVDPDGNLRIKP